MKKSRPPLRRPIFYFRFAASGNYSVKEAVFAWAFADLAVDEACLLPKMLINEVKLVGKKRVVDLRLNVGDAIGPRHLTYFFMIISKPNFFNSPAAPYSPPENSFDFFGLNSGPIDLKATP
jgi:hypothetical protein